MLKCYYREGGLLIVFKLYGGMANLMIELILLYIVMKVCKISDKIIESLTYFRNRLYIKNEYVIFI